MKLKWRKIFRLLGVMIFLIMLAITFVYSTIQRRKAILSKIRIEFSDKEQYISSTQIETLIKKKIPKWKGCKLDTLETDWIESEIEELAWVKKADIFKGYGHDKNGFIGILKVHITQPHPKFRVQNGETGYYVSEDRTRLPLSSLYTPRVMVVTGNVDKELIEGNLYDFIDYIEQHRFWNSLFEQVHVTRKKEVVLVPRIGGHLIEFGPICDVEEKFTNLEAMYEKGFNEETWKKYRSVSLKFKNQVICTLK